MRLAWAQTVRSCFPAAAMPIPGTRRASRSTSRRASGRASRIARTRFRGIRPVDYALPASDPKHWDGTYGEHGDGTPGAPHTYDLVTYLPPEAVGGKGALLFPVSRFAYNQASTNWAHKLTLDAPAWSRASTAPATANINLLGMADYDPTSKRVWIVSASGTGAYADSIAYLDFSTGVGVPGSVSLGRDYLIYSGTMRFWRGLDGTKRYLVMLSYDPRARINIIDLDAPQTGVHPVVIANVPESLGYPGSGFALGKTRGFAMHPTPDQDGAQIYDITPPADAINGTSTSHPEAAKRHQAAGGAQSDPREAAGICRIAGNRHLLHLGVRSGLRV